MISDFLRLSLNNMKKRKLRSILTMIGIFIGIAAVVSLISLGDGLKTAVTGQFGSLSADRLVVQNAGTGFGPPGSTTVRKLTSHDLDLIKKINGVKIASPRFIRMVKVEYNKVAEFFYVASVPEDQQGIDMIYGSFDAKISEGRLLKAGDKGKILLGSSIASSAQFGKKIRVGSKITVQEQDFEVVGILKESSSLQTNNAIIMPEKDLKELFGIGDEIDFIAVQVSDPNQASEVASKIEQVLRKDRGEKVGGEDFSVQTPLQAISSVNSVLTIINIIVTGIAAISLIIGGIGIANTMYTSVLERTKEIGTMKAIGAKNSDILWIIILESGLLGLVGGVVGALLGLGMAFVVSSGANAAFGGKIIDVVVSYTLLIGAISFSFLIGVFSGLLPALQASKLKPVEALRG